MLSEKFYRRHENLANASREVNIETVIIIDSTKKGLDASRFFLKNISFVTMI